MTTANTPPSSQSHASNKPPASLLERNYFLLRRLHSLTGIVPIGVFLIAHLVTNSSIIWGKWALREQPVAPASLLEGGARYFSKEVVWINEQVPHLLLIEITLWAAIAFHSILGIVYALSGKPNTSRYAYQDNFRYTLQRITGYVGIFFILYHVATLRWGWDFLVPGGTRWSYEASASSLAAAIRGGETWSGAGVAVAACYMLGITALVFHFANGLWTAAITWGLTISEQAQKRWGKVCLAIGAGLMLMAWGALAGFIALNIEKTRRIESELPRESAPAKPSACAAPTPALGRGASADMSAFVWCARTGVDA